MHLRAVPVDAAELRFTRRARRAIVHALALVGLGACTDGMGNSRQLPVVSLVLVSGDWQSGEVGTALAQPLTVILVDADGYGAAGRTVHFVGDSGTVLDGPVTSDASGKATARWQLGPIAKVQSILVTLGALEPAPPIYFHAEAVPGPASLITLLGGNPIALPLTRLDTLVVTVADRFGNAVANGDINWSVQTGGGTVQPLSARTDARGQARAVWTLGESSQPQSLRINSGAATNLVITSVVAAMVATEASSGSDHSCALVEGGTAYCWGSNAFGQLGIGTRDWGAHPLPGPVQGDLKFKSIAAGASHTCGLTLTGETYCWGGNDAGQIGAPPSWDVFSRPTRIAAERFTAITAGGYHTCGLTSLGAAWCWGDNSLGQLGNGADRSAAVPFIRAGTHVPTVVAGSETFASLSAHYTLTCGVANSGFAYCWGGAEGFELGNVVSQRCHFVWTDEYTGIPGQEYDAACSTSPVLVQTKATVSSIAIAQFGACAVLATTELECWGAQYGPRIIPGARVTKAWIIEATVCGTDGSGSVPCWRWYGPPVAERPFGDGPLLVNIHSSGRHHCGLSSTPTGIVYCWGSNFEGALGDGTTQHRDFPVPVIGLPLSDRRN